MADRQPKTPPVGVKLSTDVERRASGLRARVRWTDPLTSRRHSRTTIVADMDAATEFFNQMRQATETGSDPTITLTRHVEQIGDRWLRGVDLSSTGDTYRSALKLHVLPSLGHLSLPKITAGVIDRTIDDWETKRSASTIKNSIAALVRVLDEAVRDDLLRTNPARHRAKRSLNRRAQSATPLSPRSLAVADLASLTQLAEKCGAIHISYHDHVMLCALLAARGSEVSGLRVGDVDWTERLVTIERQIYPGAGGLIEKQTKGRKARYVPILDALEPVLRRLTDRRDADEPLLRGPRGGVLTTATVRNATNWDQLVTELGMPKLTRHSLRHTGATWLADSGIPLHVLQQILGHQSIETTKAYLHPDTRHFAAARQQANAYLADWSLSGPQAGSTSRSRSSRANTL